MKKAFVRNLPKNLTSYDFLKSLAVITMIIDHMGIYFFPDQMGWRVVGRLSLPIWMFLIGYAQTRKIPPALYWGAGILVLSNIVMGQGIFPLNVLATIIILRLTIDYVMQFALSSYQNMFLGVAAITIIVFPTMFVFEYGTQAVLFGMFGYMVRHQKKIGFSNEQILIFMFVALTVYSVFQKITIGLDDIEFYTMAAGLLLVNLMLSVFQPKLYPELTEKLPAFVTEIFKLLGRQTLEIYVIHILLFQAAAFWLFPGRFSLFDVSLF
ncbi:MAG TPA: TraX family protein [Alphaproteobacteria bacterium]|nr:TraX family protein [Alphaproteobacteria bacterium]